ncbi:dihydropteroate synthase [Flexivirga sp. ID2601S]|uniref:Dihydropteroate synthase n=1 Tax=Flexivirga aerilata TaxID=1656889 RepID=A0A849AL18_9MICO|nr:dihydropteroate synthase [Flexivirga aerilata]NNG41059.1 dihydropteroate synthase [Flexivirga aerilata]
MPISFRGRPTRTDRALIMAIVNRTPDSFYDQGATFADDAALRAAEAAVRDGADILDIGGVKAGVGDDVDVAEETQRVVPFVASLRERFPDVVISVDTWRHEVGAAACAAGADLLNDTWAGHDPELADVAIEFGAGYVCSHTGGATPRSRPYRVRYDDVVADVIADTTARAEALVARGLPRDGILLDPTHDFGKNTWHSLTLTRRLDELVATGWPVLVALSNKDFVGEALGGLPPGERLVGTLAATALSAWHGASVFRAHNVAETRQALEMVAAIQGRRTPPQVTRGLA